MVALVAALILSLIESVPGMIAHHRKRPILGRRMDVAAELNRCNYIGSLLTSSTDQ